MNPGAGCSERLCSLHCGETQKPNWTWICETCVKRSCFEQGIGLHIPKRPFPTSVTGQVCEPSISPRTEWLLCQTRTWKALVQPCAFPQTFPYSYNSGQLLALLHLSSFSGHRLVAETRRVSATKCLSNPFSGGWIKALITRNLTP